MSECQSPGGSRGWTPAMPTLPHQSTPAKDLSDTEARGRRGRRRAWRLKWIKRGTKSKGKDQTKGQSHHPEGTKEVCTRTGHASRRGPRAAQLPPGEPGTLRGGAECGGRGPVCTRGAGRAGSEGGALGLLLRVSLLCHRVSPSVLQGAQAERRPELYVDGGDVKVDEICKAAEREAAESGGRGWWRGHRSLAEAARRRVGVGLGCSAHSLVQRTRAPQSHPARDVRGRALRQLPRHLLRTPSGSTPGGEAAFRPGLRKGGQEAVKSTPFSKPVDHRGRPWG